MSRLPFLLSAVLCGALLSGVVGHRRARADGVADEAEINFRLGAERYQEGDYRAALAHFLASQRLSPNRNVRFNIVRTFQRLGMHAEAYRWCQEALRDERDPAMLRDLQQLLSSIERDVAVLQIESSPPGATIYADREELGSLGSTPARLALPEGEHKVILRLDGHARAELPPVRLERGKVQQLSASLSRIVGRVSVTAAGPSEVRVDSEEGPLECMTPCSLELTPGLHVLHFHREGYRIAPRQLRVAAEQSVSIQVQGAPRTGSLVVTSDARDALVQVDGEARGFTPAVLSDIPVGRRALRVSLAGHEPYETTVDVLEGQTVELRDLSLVPTREVTAASRVNQSVDDAPASVSVVSRYELESFRYPTIAEALRGQRGISISTDSVYHNLTMRGLGQPGDYGNRILVLQDGATLNDNILWQSYVGYDGRVDLGDLSRIEIVRGPGSVLYGTGAVTGLVNLVPRAIPERPQTELRIQASDTSTARARAAHAMPLGAHGGMALSLSGAHGSGRSVRLPAPVNATVEEVERFDALTAQTRAHYRDLTFQGFLTYREQDIPAGAYGALVSHPSNWVRDTRGLLEVRYEPRLAGDKLKLYTRAFANLYHFDTEQAYPDEQAGSMLVQERYRGAWFGAEARIVAQLVDALRITAGSELQMNTTARLQGHSVVSGSRSDTLSESLPYQVYAGYGVLDWTATRMLTISAGARVDAWSTFGATVNPRLNVVLRPDADNVLKLVAGRAFRAPSFYELRYQAPGTQLRSDYMGNELKPELAWSGELEYTRRFLQHWAVVGAVHAQYAERLLEVVVADPALGPEVVYRNSTSQALTVGADVELRRELYRGLLFTANYGYLYPRYVGEAPQGSTRLPNAPAHFGSLRVIVPTWGDTRLALRNSLEAPRRISSTTTARTDPAVITDVVFSGRLGDSGFDLAVGLYNLFDFRLPLPIDPTFVTRTMPQPGRTLLVSIGLQI